MQLNNNYVIIFENKYVTLQFSEEREIKKKNPETGKLEGTGEFKIFKENYYFNSLESALKWFVRESIGEKRTAEDILAKLDEVYKLIKTIKVEQTKI